MESVGFDMQLQETVTQRRIRRGVKAFVCLCKSGKM